MKITLSYGSWFMIKVRVNGKVGVNFCLTLPFFVFYAFLNLIFHKTLLAPLAKTHLATQYLWRGY